MYRKITKIANITTFLVIIDILFTLYWKSLYGGQIELNPIGSVIISNEWLIVFKVVLCWIVCRYLDEHSEYVIYNTLRWIVLFVYVLLGVYHFTLFIYVQIITR